MHTTISAPALVISLILLVLGARAGSYFPSEYAFAIGNWLVRPGNLPVELESRMAAIAQHTLMLKLALPTLVGFATYLGGRVLYVPRHDGNPHISLIAGAFAGAFAAGLLLAWPFIAEWTALSPSANAPDRVVFVGIYIAQMIAVACLARGGAGLASLIAYPRIEAPHTQSLAKRAQIAGIDLGIGTGLILAASLATTALLSS